MSLAAIIKDSLRELDSMRHELLNDLHKLQKNCLHMNVRIFQVRDDGLIGDRFECLDCGVIWSN